jgi:hypothetical protein
LGNFMDLKALMQKLETIDKKQNLMEAEKKETTWTDKSGKKHPATQVKGDKYTGKEAEKEDKKKTDEGIVFNSSIAQMLLREFGLEEAPVANPYQGADAEKFAAMSPADQAWLTKGGGKPDINDQFILARAPNKGKPAAGGDGPQTRSIMKPPPAPAAGGQAASPAPASNTQDMGDGSKLTTDPKTGATAATNDDGTPYIPGSNPNLPKNQTKTQDMGDGSKLTTGPGGVAATNDDGTPYVPGSNPNLPQNKPAGGQAASPAMTAADQDDADMGAAMRANAQAANGVNAAGQNVTMPDGTNPETGEKTTVATAPAAGGQAASPAKPAAAKPAFKADPVGQSIANQLKMTTPDAIKLFQKNNGLQADGMIGPATTKALQAAAQKMGVTTTSGVGTSTAGAGRGGQGGPTATQMAQAPAAGGQAASPAANPKAAEIDAQLAKYKKYPGSNAQIIARLEKEKAALAGGSTQTPAQQAVSKDLGSFAGESVRYQDDEILARIKSAFRF